MLCLIVHVYVVFSSHLKHELNNDGQCIFSAGTGYNNRLSISSNGTEFSAEKNPVVYSLNDITHNLDIGTCLSPESNHQYEKDLKHDSTILPSEISVEEDDSSFKSSSNNTVECVDNNLGNGSEHEVTELDVESLLKKQDTHDLYCPNCNSCITRRIILRKRKRNIRIAGVDLKRSKAEKIIESEFTSTSVGAPSNQADSTVDFGNVPHASNDYEQERQPDIFRCLSCFSIFIPTGIHLLHNCDNFYVIYSCYHFL